MSRCFTVTHAGVVPGIEISGDQNSQAVDVGAEYAWSDNCMTPRRQPLSVQLNRLKRPSVVDGRLTYAKLRRHGQLWLLETPRINDRGVLVLIDTQHTSPCDTGGTWSINNTKFMIAAAQGREGHRLYKVPSSADPGAKPMDEVDEETCYAKALLLLFPGAHLTVTFNAPGRLVAEVAFDGGEPTFRLTENAVDDSYKYSPREHVRTFEPDRSSYSSDPLLDAFDVDFL